MSRKSPTCIPTRYSFKVNRLKPSIKRVIKTGRTKNIQVQTAWEYYVLAEAGLTVDLGRLSEKTVQILLEIKSQIEKKKERERSK